MTTYQGLLAHRMTVSNELSSDIASAILAAKERSPRQLSELKEIVLRVHSTLQELAEKERASPRRHPHEKFPRP
jgi:hypothetical protein